MKVAVFLTADRDRAAALLARCRQRWPDAALVAFANDVDRLWLAERHPGAELRRDKPPGGKLKFVRALRAERFDHVVVAWHGGERLQPLRVVALALGRPAFAVDERDRERRVVWWQPWTWAGHALRRGVKADPLAVARGIASLYRATLGALVAVVWLPLRRALQRARAR